MKTEIIVVDNGSTDGSREYLKSLATITLVTLEHNVGLIKGKNIGVQKSSGEYVLLLDGDILIPNVGILEDILREYRQLKNVAYLSILMVDEEDETSIHYGGFYSPFGLGGQKFESRLTRKLFDHYTGDFQIGFPIGGNMFFSRDIWNTLKPFDENQIFNLDDFDVGARAYVMGYANYLYYRDHFVHLGRQERIDNNRWAWKYQFQFSGHSRVILKYYSAKNLPIALIGNGMYFAAKTLKHVVQRRHLGSVFALLKSMLTFFKNLPDTLKQRRYYQKNRKSAEDTFLHIAPPMELL